MIRIFIALLLAVFMAPNIAYSKTIRATVKSGAETPLAGFYLYRKETCSISRYPKISIKQPKNGTIRVVKRKQAARSGKCKGRQFNTITVYYKSKPGYRGKDSGTVYYSFPKYVGEAVAGGTNTRLKLTVK